MSEEASEGWNSDNATATGRDFGFDVTPGGWDTPLNGVERALDGIFGRGFSRGQLSEEDTMGLVSGMLGFPASLGFGLVSGLKSLGINPTGPAPEGNESNSEFFSNPALAELRNALGIGAVPTNAPTPEAKKPVDYSAIPFVLSGRQAGNVTDMRPAQPSNVASAALTDYAPKTTLRPQGTKVDYDTQVSPALRRLTQQRINATASRGTPFMEGLNSKGMNAFWNNANQQNNDAIAGIDAFGRSLTDSDNKQFGSGNLDRILKGVPSYAVSFGDAREEAEKAQGIDNSFRSLGQWR